MTKNELCTILTGREYTKEVNNRIIDRMHGTDLVIVFGGSDDLVEFRGAINDEADCYGGGKIYLNNKGLLVCECEDEDCPYFKRLKEQAVMIEALWCAEPGISWTYKTDIPHSTFKIWEDKDIYCRGIVFNLADVV